jgi:predicted nucleotidyltransferase
MARNKHRFENLSLHLAQELHGKLENALGSQVQVTLFGSQARGEATDESDIDVLVVLPDLEKNTLDIVLEIAWEIGFEAGKVLSVVSATPEEMDVLSASPFFQAIQREGIVV